MQDQPKPSPSSPDHALPYDQAVAVAVAAWSKWSTPAGAGARRDYVRQNLTLEMLWALVDHWCRRGSDVAIRFLLDDAARRIAEEREAGSGKKIKPFIFRPLDVSQERSDAIRACREDEAKKDAIRNLKAKAEEAFHLLAEVDVAEPSVAMAAAIEEGAKNAGRAAENAEKLRLYAFLIDGRPLADCTAREALAWCERQERCVEFVRALCQGVPLDDTLGRWYGTAPVEVEDIWKRVNSEEFTQRRQAYRRRFLEAWQEAKRLADEIGSSGQFVLRNKAIEMTNSRNAFSYRVGKGHINDMPDPFGLKDGSIGRPGIATEGRSEA